MDLERLIASSELGDAIRGCVEQLPAALREVFVLREMQNLDTTEICKILGRTVTHVGGAAPPGAHPVAVVSPSAGLEGFPMIRCKEVATLLSSDHLAAQTVWRRAGGRLHLMMCRHCRRFARQLALLKQAAVDLGAAFDDEVDTDLSQRLQEKLGR